MRRGNAEGDRQSQARDVGNENRDDCGSRHQAAGRMQQNRSQTSPRDLKERIGRILVGVDREGRGVVASALSAQGAMAAILKDAIKPNLVQNLEGGGAFIHCGPFANVSHGNNSILADRLALKLADYVVTESGFGSECGAEKMFDIKCRVGGLTPSAAVIVATVRALKMHGGVPREALGTEDVAAVQRGLANLEKHVENVRQFGVPAVVALNHFTADSHAEVKAVMDAAGHGASARLNVSGSSSRRIGNPPTPLCHSDR